MADFDPRAFEQWTPAAQERALARLNELRNDSWRPFYCPNHLCDGRPHGDWEWSHARRDQRPPMDPDWFLWAQIAGRGSGKTLSGSRYTNRMSEHVGHIIVVAPTSADLRDVVVDGESGILASAQPGKRPQYEPSKRRLTWPSGCRALLVSAEEPDRLRGPQSGFAWCDEAAIYPDLDAVWDNLTLGLRLGRKPRALMTTTPKPRPLLKQLMADDSTRLSRATTFDNLHNLAPTFAEKVVKRFEGTRVGRQELYAEMLTDVEGALWTWDMVERARIVEGPEGYERIVVAVDPAGTANRRSDETGVVVVGYDQGTTYVIADRSGRYSPNGWANVIRNAYDEHQADAVVVETNYGGDMVEHTLRSSGVDARIMRIHARRGKSLRAEPVVSLFEQDRVKMLPGMPELDDELTSWVPFEGASPNRVDAMVYGVTYVAKAQIPAQIGNPLRLVV